jgi:hypothetical protein
MEVIVSKHHLLSVLGLALLALGVLLSSSAVASAHERRQVASYTFVVGWVTEPAYVNLPNAVDLRVSRTADGSPVTGLEQTLKVEVTHGSKKTEVALRPRFNTPGAYDGRMVPSAVGDYSFRFFGTIEGLQVNETFTSGPNTFNSIAALEGWPNPLPSSQQLDETIKGLEQRIVSLESDDGGSGSAMLFGIAGLVVGALGLATAGYSLARRQGGG